MYNIDIWREAIKSRAVNIVDYMCDQHVNLDEDVPDEEFFGKSLEVYLVLEELISKEPE